MSWRTVVISKRCKLDFKMGYMVIRSEETQKIFIDELSALIIENPAVSLTGCLLEELTNKKVKVIFCDSRHNPMTELLPYYGNYSTSRKIREQAVWSDEIKDLIWQAIVTEKIRAQMEFLYEKGKSDEGDLLYGYLKQIEPGDVTNREGHAAKVYFNAIFGMDFSRRKSCGINSALNYGYSIILSSVNREIVSAGYLTQIGVFHDNTFNAFNLGSDLMEPFRVLVDRKVYEMNPGDSLSSDERYSLVDILNQYVIIDGSQQTVNNAINIYVRSVFQSIENANTDLIKFYEL